MIIIHPNNMGYLSSLKIGDDEGNFHRISGIEILEDSMIPERNIEEMWEPPQPSRFVTYGPEDESWMRPLGLGTVKQIDVGPLFVEMREAGGDWVIEMICEPFTDDSLFRDRCQFLKSFPPLAASMMLNFIV